MSIEIYSQVKGIINVVLTISIAICSGFVSQNTRLWFLIITFGLVQVILICIPSIEEKFYRDRIRHMERQDKLTMDYEEKTKQFKLSNKFQKMQNEAKEINEGETRKFINFVDLVKSNKIRNLSYHKLK
jgi:hypothetical protein